MARIAYYYDIRLSENIVEQEGTGFLICKDVVIGRTGFQKYKGSELPDDQLKRLGITVDPQEVVEVYRPADEVFDPEAIASFEGMPITDGHPPDGDFVDAENIKDLGKGHLQNVRKGPEPLESGDWPLMADALLTHADLIHKVKVLGRRELSGGYDYNLGLDGEKLIQKDIRGNHVAVVPKGRAGAEARINDAALQETAPQPAVTKEHRVEQITLKHLLGIGLKAFAADAKPEELAEAAELVKEHKAADEPIKPEPQPPAKPVEEPKPAQPAADPDRERLHKALDKVLDRRQAADAESEDADLEELKKLLSEYLTEEEGEEQHQDEGEEGEEEGEDEEEVGHEDEEEREGEMVEKPRAGDALLVEPIGKTRSAKATDYAVTAQVLRTLKPGIARSKDAGLRRAFDAACDIINQAARKAGSGSYGAVVRAATARSADAAAAIDKTTELNAAYAAMHRKNPSEVK